MYSWSSIKGLSLNLCHSAGSYRIPDLASLRRRVTEQSIRSWYLPGNCILYFRGITCKGCCYMADINHRLQCQSYFTWSHTQVASYSAYFLPARESVKCAVHCHRSNYHVLLHSAYSSNGRIVESTIHSFPFPQHLNVSNVLYFFLGKIKKKIYIYIYAHDFLFQ